MTVQKAVSSRDTPGLTGWAAMAKTVRDFDEEKIRDCKEDIDTLLVFVSATSYIHASSALTHTIFA